MKHHICISITPKLTQMTVDFMCLECKMIIEIELWIYSFCSLDLLSLQFLSSLSP